MAVAPVSCDYILEALRNMRAIDDKIIHELNLATPTPSFRGQVDPSHQCQELFVLLETTYSQRTVMINGCLNESIARIKDMRGAMPNRDDVTAMKNLRNEQFKMRELQNELGVEEIVRQRSFRVFQEKCHQFFSAGGR